MTYCSSSSVQKEFQLFLLNCFSRKLSKYSESQMKLISRCKKGFQSNIWNLLQIFYCFHKNQHLAKTTYIKQQASSGSIYCWHKQELTNVPKNKQMIESGSHLLNFTVPSAALSHLFITKTLTPCLSVYPIPSTPSPTPLPCHTHTHTPHFLDRQVTT